MPSDLGRADRYARIVDDLVVGERTPSRPASAPRRLVDVLTVALVAGVFWLPSTLEAQQAWRVAVGLGLTAAAAGAMLARRRAPTAAVLVAGAATIVGTALGTCQDFMVAAAWCLYPLAIRRAARTQQLFGVLVVGLLGTVTVAGFPQDDGRQVAQSMVLSVASLCVAWLLGAMVGRHIDLAREAESARVRLEVAREVHDVVGHALGLVSAEAGVMRALPDADEHELRETLGNIETQSRRALEEIQALVRGLRSGSQPPVYPGVADSVEPRLAELIEATRASAVPIRARLDLHEAVDEEVAAFVVRVVQEGLANVVRHARGAACTVDVESDDGGVVVRVRDDGPGVVGATGPGFGLRGMRERARLVGGSVVWGNRPEGGFEVTAWAPLTAAMRGLSTFG